MIADDIVERVREEADIVQIVGEFVKLKRVGNSYRGPCPFHMGTHDNFAVSPRGGYVCFVCGEKGDLFTFVRKRLGLDFVEAVKWVGNKVGVEVVETKRAQEGPDPREPLWEVNAAAAEWFQRQLADQKVGAGARQYLQSRTLAAADAERFALGFAPREIGAMRAHLHAVGYDDARQLAAGLLVKRDDNEEPRPRFRDRLIFPIFDAQGRVVGFGGRVMGEGEPKYLNSAESDVFAKRKLLYGLNWAKHAVRKADRLLVVEGYFDAIRLMLAGIEEVVAPLGTALTEAQASLIRKYTKNVYLLYDSDAAGQKATFRAGDELLRNGIGVRVISLPEGEDPDTFVASHGAAGLERAIADSIDVFDRKVQILERGGWFADLRRKRQALDKLLPTIRAAADPLMRDLYVARTAEVAGISKELLYRELATTGERGARAPVASSASDDEPPLEMPPDLADEPPPRSGERRAPVDRRQGRHAQGARAERELIRALLHFRRYVDAVAERIGAESFEDPTYRAIFSELLARDEDASIEEIAQALDVDATATLQELLDEQGGLDHVDVLIRDSVSWLRKREIDAEMLEIQRSFPLATDEEKDDLFQRQTLRRRELEGLSGPARTSRWGALRGKR